jgi:hypothetical protein
MAGWGGGMGDLKEKKRGWFDCLEVKQGVAYKRSKGLLTREAKVVSGTIIRGTLKTPNSQLVTPISIKLQRPDGHD